MLTCLAGCSVEGRSYSFIKNSWAHLLNMKFYYIKLSLKTIVMGRDIMLIHRIMFVTSYNVTHFIEASAPVMPQCFIR